MRPCPNRKANSELRCRLPASVLKEVDQLIKRDGLKGRADLLIQAVKAYTLYRQPFEQAPSARTEAIHANPKMEQALHSLSRTVKANLAHRDRRRPRTRSAAASDPNRKRLGAKEVMERGRVE